MLGLLGVIGLLGVLDLLGVLGLIGVLGLLKIENRNSFQFISKLNSVNFIKNILITKSSQTYQTGYINIVIYTDTD